MFRLSDPIRLIDRKSKASILFFKPIPNTIVQPGR